MASKKYKSNRIDGRSNGVVPTHLPPVPVVLDPTPKQITPIGTIPIYTISMAEERNGKAHKPLNPARMELSVFNTARVRSG